MDSVISQFDKSYLEQLMRYNRLITQRNALLKNQNSPSGLQLYDEQIAPLAHYINEKRHYFLNELLPIFLDYYSKISGKNEEVSISYHSQLSENNYETLCQQQQQKDQAVQLAQLVSTKMTWLLAYNNSW